MTQLAILALQVALCMVTVCVCDSCVEKFVITAHLYFTFMPLWAF